MYTDRVPTVRRPQALVCLVAGLLFLAPARSLCAQEMPYRFEVGAAGAVQRFDAATDLERGIGPILRAAAWLPYNFSIEAEAAFLFAPTVGDSSWRATTVSAAALYNLPLGNQNYLYFKAGYGSTNYDGDVCPGFAVGAGPCGSTGVLVGGLGLRLGLSYSLAIRGEGMLSRSESLDDVGAITNVGGNIGISYLIGGEPPLDSDRDGVVDGDDRCPDTPAGAIADRTGCPSDGDGDAVLDGLDQCPRTPAGVGVNERGCPVDTDNDGVDDSSDRCPGTDPGSLVNASGCPTDTDNDRIPDGVDRCPGTAEGATVDALGCPGDEDSDGVLDGIDQCPRTPTGARVDATGCPEGTETGAVDPPPASRVVPRRAALATAARRSLPNLPRSAAEPRCSPA